jgi:hypothetical protein
VCACWRIWRHLQKNFNRLKSVNSERVPRLLAEKPLSKTIWSTIHFVNYTFHRLYILSTIHFVDYTFHQLYISSTIHFVDYTFCWLYISSTVHLIDYAFHQLYISSTIHFINYTFHQLYISSTIHFVDFCKTLLTLCFCVWVDQMPFGQIVLDQMVQILGEN